MAREDEDMPLRTVSRLFRRAEARGLGTSSGQEKAQQSTVVESPVRIRRSKRLAARIQRDPDALDVEQARRARKRTCRRSGRKATQPGYFGLLPIELLELVLEKCEPFELSRLAATCRYFATASVIPSAAQSHIRSIPRAKSMQPNHSKKESWLSLLHFFLSQSHAAAQATAMAMGCYHTVALLTIDIEKEDPTVATSSIPFHVCAFGRGFHGQLGHGEYCSCSSPMVCSKSADGKSLSKASGQPAVVACGSHHSALISRRGELFTWGLSSSGELGHRDTPIDINIPHQVQSLHRTRIVSVSAGANHTLAISETGELWSCGRGRHGQLGLGTFEDSTTLCRVRGMHGVRIVSAAAGQRHSVALGSHGNMYTWGCGRYGQLGLQNVADFIANQPGTPVAVHHPQRVTLLEPSKLPPSARITAIAAGHNHTVALSVGGDLMVCGHNKHGALGLGDTLDRHLPTNVRLAADLGVRPGEKVGLKRAVQVQCGSMHTLAMLQIGGRLAVIATGYNASGQLGLGDHAERLEFTIVKGLEHAPVRCIVSGENHCAAICKDGDIYVWGRGDCGQLGLGNDFSHSTPQRLHEYRAVHPNRTLRRQP